MDILATAPPPAPNRPMRPPTAPAMPQAVLSTQVSGPRYFFLGLGTRRQPGLVPAYGGFEQCNPDYLVQREGTDFLTLEFVVAGEGDVSIDGAVSPLQAGTVFCYDRPNRIRIRSNPRQPMRKYFLCLAGTRAVRRVRAAGLKPGDVVRVAMFPEVQAIFDDLIREGLHQRATAARICAALVEVLLLKLEELVGLAGTSSRGAEEAFLHCKGMVETNATELATLGDIARLARLDVSRLCRLFRRYQGMSPYQFLLRRKMALAAELLLKPDMLVKEVAAHVGFRDPYHFSRCFKAIHRMAPRDFQRSLTRTG